MNEFSLCILLVKVWTLSGRCIHIFRGHSKAITQLILHPESMSVILTCSLDGSIRMWSLDTMEALCSYVSLLLFCL